MFKEALSPNASLDNGPALTVTLHKILLITMSTRRLRKDIHIGDMGVVDKIQEGSWDESGRVFVPYDIPEEGSDTQQGHHVQATSAGGSSNETERRCLRITGQILAGKSESESVWCVPNVAEKQVSSQPRSDRPPTPTNQILTYSTRSRFL